MSAFEQAQKDVKTLTQRPDNNAMLALYAHFKQATAGDAQGERPGMFDLVGRAKYDAWSALQGMTREDAETSYIKKVESLMAAEK
ncbi:MAG: acyl-CoA-binding protein [Pseudomonadales bacterium]|nr:acyl-CoA-binding protein [Pseudomonadales bacterium]